MKKSFRYYLDIEVDSIYPWLQLGPNARGLIGHKVKEIIQNGMDLAAVSTLSVTVQPEPEPANAQR